MYTDPTGHDYIKFGSVSLNTSTGKTAPAPKEKTPAKPKAEVKPITTATTTISLGVGVTLNASTGKVTKLPLPVVKAPSKSTTDIQGTSNPTVPAGKILVKGNIKPAISGGISSDAPIEGLKVCAYKNDTKLGEGLTDVNGHFEILISNSNTTDISIKMDQIRIFLN